MSVNADNIRKNAQVGKPSKAELLEQEVKKLGYAIHSWRPNPFKPHKIIVELWQPEGRSVKGGGNSYTKALENALGLLRAALKDSS